MLANLNKTTTLTTNRSADEGEVAKTRKEYSLEHPEFHKIPTLINRHYVTIKSDIHNMCMINMQKQCHCKITFACYTL